MDGGVSGFHVLRAIPGNLAAGAADHGAELPGGILESWGPLALLSLVFIFVTVPFFLSPLFGPIRPSRVWKWAQWAGSLSAGLMGGVTGIATGLSLTFFRGFLQTLLTALYGVVGAGTAQWLYLSDLRRSSPDERTRKVVALILGFTLISLTAAALSLAGEWFVQQDIPLGIVVTGRSRVLDSWHHARVLATVILAWCVVASLARGWADRTREGGQRFSPTGDSSWNAGNP